MSVKIEKNAFGSPTKATLFVGSNETTIENCQFGDTQGRHIVVDNTPRGKGDDYNGVGLNRNTPDEEIIRIKEFMMQTEVNINDEEEVKKAFESCNFDRWVANGATICTIARFIIADFFTKK